MATEHLQTVFAMAHTDMRGLPLNNRGRTLRLTIPCNVDAFALSVRFSNLWGKNPLSIGEVSLALCDDAGILQPGTLVPLTVGGVLAFTLPAGEQLISDTIRFPIKAGDYFALSIYYPTDELVTSGNWVNNFLTRSRPGNFTADEQLQSPSIASRLARTAMTSDITVMATSVCEIVASCEKPSRLLGCFGDSITQQGNWLSPLSKLLYCKYPGEITACNLGISGNRLLSDSPPTDGNLYGCAGIRRFEENLLTLHGLTHAIVEIGTNDIGLPGSHGLPEAELITLPQYIEGMTLIAGRLHKKGVKVYAATLCPRPLQRPYTVEREALRLEINRWIRTAACFDAVLDFDEVLRRDDLKPGMKDGCALPDGLHPSLFGGMMLAKSIPLSLFGGEGDA